jgi:hypothetical protein
MIEFLRICELVKECTSKFQFGFRKNVPGGKTRGIKNSEKSLKVVEHLGGKSV